MPRPTVFIVSAPSGAGKTSLARALVEAREDIELAISHTTRSRRPGERNGVDYHFIDRGAFESMIEAGQFLEYAQVFGNFYGTSIQTVESLLTAGSHALLDIDWQGARVVRAKFSGACSIFVLPPSLEILERRLRERGQDSEETITRRMGDAMNEMSHQDEYEHNLINDNFEKTLTELNRLIDDRIAASNSNPAELSV